MILGAGPAGLGAAYKVAQENRANVTMLERPQVVGGNAGRSVLEISFGGLAVPEATPATLLIPLGVAAVDGVANSLLRQMILLVGGLFAGLVHLVLRRVHLHNECISTIEWWPSRASNLEHPFYA